MNPHKLSKKEYLSINLFFYTNHTDKVKYVSFVESFGGWIIH